MMYLDGFKDIAAIENEYREKGALESSEVLFAFYGGGSYEGQSLVIYKKDGKYFEVNGSHCSCYGLEDQWSPEETTLESIFQRYFTDDERMPYVFYHDRKAYDALRTILEERLAA